MASPDGPSVIKPFRVHAVAAAALAIALLLVAAPNAWAEGRKIEGNELLCSLLSPLPGVIPPVEEIATSFETRVFHLEGALEPPHYQVVRRWNGFPHDVYAPDLTWEGWHGGAPAELREHIVDELVRLSCLTGLRFRLIEAPLHWSKRGIYLGSAMTLGTAFYLRDPVPERIRSTCNYWSSWGELILWKTVLIGRSLSVAEKIRCIEAGLQSALGVLPWAWAGLGSPLTEFTIHDAILVRLLYDPSLHLDMSRMAAMDRVREILPGMLKALKAEGQRVLYQPPR